MQVNQPAAVARPAAPPTAGVVRAASGDLSGVPAGEAVPARVTAAGPEAAVLDVNGRAVTVRPGTGLLPGTEVLVRLMGGTTPQLELLGRVLPAVLPTPAVATPEAVANAVLRTAAPPDLGPSLAALAQELDTLPPASREAATPLRELVHSFLPADRTPTAAELQTLVEDSGLHYEAKMARRPDDAAAVGSDLKGGLLKLIQAGKELGAVLPAAHAALDGIEAQQAANAVAQVREAAFVLQVPFPDGDRWRTLHLAVEPDRAGGPADDPGGFRLLMHVTLAELGDTWVDSGLSAGRLRAVVYLDAPAARERVRAELPALRADLRADGYAEVLLDVRPTDALPAARRRQAVALSAGRPDPDPVLDVEA